MPEHRQPLSRSVILMGVCGCGKSTVGKLLAQRSGAKFFDGDDFHPAENIAKMSAGIPLTDDDRAGWLLSLKELLDRESEPIIVACSALKQSYREVLKKARSAPFFIHLDGDRETLLQRLTTRADHFMGAHMLDSQLATLEAPDPQSADSLVVSIRLSPEEIVSKILA